MLNNINITELLEFAIAGIDSEIEKTERKILTGYKIINKEIESSKSEEEIKQLVRLKKDHIEHLKNLKDIYAWELSLIEQK